MTKRNYYFLLPLTCLILSLSFPRACMEGVKDGLSLAINFAFPSLFPAFVLSGLFIRTLSGKSEKSALIIPFLLGLICGFPIGAKSICSLVQEGKLTRKKAAQLLPLTSGASPGFLISYCGITLFSNHKKGLFLYFLQSFFLLVFFLLFFGKDLFKKGKKDWNSGVKPHFISLIPKAVSDGINAFFYVSACIVFFSFLLSLLFAILPLSPLAKVLLSLFLELTGGAKNLCLIQENLRLPLCAFGIGWNGFSVHLQTLGLILEKEISPKFYFLMKGIFSLLFFVSTLFLQKVL